MRSTWVSGKRLISIPTVVALVGALGALGLSVAMVALLAMLTRGGDGAMWFVIGMLAFMSAVMLAAGRAAARSELILLWVDGELLRWSERGNVDARPVASVALALGEPPGSYAHRRWPVHPIALVRQDGLVLVADVGGSAFRVLSAWQAKRLARRLGLALKA